MNPENFVRSYEKALGTQNWDEVAPLIHPDCTVTFSNGTCHRGKKMVQAAFQKNFNLIEGENYSISEEHWVITTEQISVLTYVYRWSGIIAGEQMSGSGRGSSTLIHTDNGWQLISEHLGPKT